MELETYRVMSMLGLGRARVVAKQFNELEPRLNAIVQDMSDDSRPAEALLHELLSVSAQLESAASEHAFRFGATSAYEAIVRDRVAALRESRFLYGQMLSEFMTRRYQPAMRTAKSAADCSWSSSPVRIIALARMTSAASNAPSRTASICVRIA